MAPCVLESTLGHSLYAHFNIICIRISWLTYGRDFLTQPVCLCILFYSWWFSGKGVSNVEISLENQTVKVTSTLPSNEILEVIKKTGKPVEYINSS